MITISHAELAASCLNTTEFPDWDLPEIVMVGRSNVGKSSLINMLLGRKNLARTSNTPGKTRRIHFYRVESSWGPFVLVDLPGYGYAKVSKSEQAAWQRKLETFMKTRKQIMLSLQLVDSRHAPQENDLAMASWLAHHHRDVPVRIILTKADKLKQSDMAKAPGIAAKLLHVPVADILVTSEQGRGREALWGLLKPIIQRNEKQQDEEILS